MKNWSITNKNPDKLCRRLTFFGRLLLVIFCLVFLEAAASHGAEVRAQKVAILVSQNIRPYIEAVEGMSAVLSESVNAKLQVFSFEKFKGKGRDVLIQSLIGERFDLVVAVGPRPSDLPRKSLRWKKPHGSIPWS